MISIDDMDYARLHHPECAAWVRRLKPVLMKCQSLRALDETLTTWEAEMVSSERWNVILPPLPDGSFIRRRLMIIHTPPAKPEWFVREQS